MKRFSNIVLWLFLILLLSLGIFIIVYSKLNPSFDGITYLSSLATFTIAVLTIVYVITTRKQLDIMSLQLYEMKRDRELQNQPLPRPISVRAYSEKPRFFYCPPDQFEAIIRHNVEVELRNVGSGPAVSIDACCFLVIPHQQSGIRFSTTSISIDVLEEKQLYPSNEEEKDISLFPEDNKALLLEQILDSDIRNLPNLELNIYYRNVLGACFHLTKHYKLYPQKENRELIKTWLERLNSFSIRNKESMELLRQLHKRSEQRADELFDELKKKCDEGLSVDNIDFDVWPIPASAEVSTISFQEYEKETKDIAYGVRINDDYKCPVNQENS